MREILFRGKRAGNGEWIFGSIVHQTDYYGDRCDRWFILEGDATNDYDIDYPIEVQKETVGQYTGLTDINGNKIFEGDILEGDLDDNLDPGAKWRSTVVWGTFGWMCKARQTCPMDEFDIREGEVIGNIYDNPELVGGEANG